MRCCSHLPLKPFSHFGDPTHPILCVGAEEGRQDDGTTTLVDDGTAESLLARRCSKLVQHLPLAVSEQSRQSLPTHSGRLEQQLTETIPPPFSFEPYMQARCHGRSGLLVSERRLHVGGRAS